MAARFPGGFSARAVFARVCVVAFLFVMLAPYVSREALAAEGPNLIQNPSFEEQGGSLPTGWAKGRWGTNTAVFRYPVTGIDGAKAAEVELTQRSSGDAKWYFAEVPVTAGATYAFSDRYKSSVATYVTVQYRHADGSFSWQDIGMPAAAGAWQTFQKTFVPPATATRFTVFHLINAVGVLRIDAAELRMQEAVPPPSTSFPEGMVSITFDDGWVSSYTAAMPILDQAGLKSTNYIISGRLGDDFPGYVNPQQVLDMQAKGHEIGAHSRTHPDLTTLTEAQMRDEIAGSRADLFAIGVTGLKSFAYPLGAFNGTVQRVTKEAGFESARSTWNGAVKKTDADLYNLRRQGLQVTTTVSQVKQWINDAKANKQWLILVLHRVDTSGTQYSTPPADLQAIVDYLKQQNSKVVTVSEGIAIKKLP